MGKGRIGNCQPRHSWSLGTRANPGLKAPTNEEATAAVQPHATTFSVVVQRSAVPVNVRETALVRRDVVPTGCLVGLAKDVVGDGVHHWTSGF